MADIGINMNRMGDYVRAKYGLPEKWECYAFDTKHLSSGDMLEIKGCVPAGVYRSGPRKGCQNWSKGTDELTTLVDPKDISEWLEKRERETGMCGRCDGTGQEWLRTCRRCLGSGKSKSEETRNADGKDAKK